MQKIPSKIELERQLTENQIATACIILWEYCYSAGFHEALDEFSWYLDDSGYDWRNK